ncbi:hypothetical protein [Frankia sp. AgKG'84/4]|uniref:hypothetical protein n=1 Tax=Frankia sp. AgKG'84/4 TaxID=573490 RepID=UPI00200E5770|nr:hypothetical protein [Frankia sp. AgKG'84/4]MCL9797190.1 hypothetical protein [Frankia sp. AgKG'84/4]
MTRDAAGRGRADRSEAANRSSYGEPWVDSAATVQLTLPDRAGRRGRPGGEGTDGRRPDALSDRARVAVDAVLLAAVAVLAAAVLVAPHSPVRAAAAFTCLALLPGWAALSRLAPLDPVTTVGLAIAFSLAADLLVAVALVFAGAWHPLPAALLLGVPSVGLVGHDLYRRGAQRGAALTRPVSVLGSTGKDSAR